MITNRVGTIGDGDNPFTLNQTREMMEELANNAYTLRTDLVNKALHSRKDINEECDYPQTTAITVSDFKEMYDRNPIGNRVVSVMSEECWQVSPRVYEDEDASNETEFEKSLANILIEENASWYKGSQEGNPIWEYSQRVDRLSGIGHYGLILFGLDDGKSLDLPVDGFNDPETETSTNLKPLFINNIHKTGKRKLLYLSVFSEFSINSVEFEANIHSPRYRKPKYYSLNLGQTSSDYVATGREERTVKVHWSRVLHVPSDNMDASDILGVPRQRPVWNNLLDLMKVYGGDAEGFWKGCVLQLFLETHPQLGGDVTLDEDALRDRMWDMQNGMQRWAALTGMGVKTVAPTVVTPQPHIDIQIDAVCIKLAIPKRIFIGSERGELASGQDDGTWNDKVRARRGGHVTCRIVVPLINRLIQYGVLPEPKFYKIDWSDPETMKPQEKAEVAGKRIEAMSKYLGGGVDALMDPMDFLTREMEIEEEEAKGILERAVEHQEEIEEEESKKTEEATEKAKEAGLVPSPIPGQPPIPAPEQPAPGKPPVPGQEAPGQPVPGEEEKPEAKSEAKKPEPEDDKEEKVENHGSKGSPSYGKFHPGSGGSGKGGSTKKGKAPNADGTFDLDADVNAFSMDDVISTGKVNPVSGKIKSPKANVAAKQAASSAKSRPITDHFANTVKHRTVRADPTLKRDGNRWKKALSHHERGGVIRWTGDDYARMRKEIANPPPQADTKRAVDAISKAPKFKGTIYRGMELRGKRGEHFVAAIRKAGPGGKVKDPTPHSASRSAKVAAQFAGSQGGVIMAIKSKTGRSIEFLSQQADEKEVVGMPNTRYKILSVRENVRVDGVLRKMYVQMEEI